MAAAWASGRADAAVARLGGQLAVEEAFGWEAGVGTWVAAADWKVGALVRLMHVL